MSAICRGCGSTMRTNDAFCGICGRAADPPAAAAPAPTITTAARPETPPTATPIVNTTEPSTSAAEAPAVALTQTPAQCLLVEMTVPDTLDPLSNARYFRQLRRRFALYAAVAAFVNFLVFLLDLLITLTSGSLGILGFLPVFAILSLIVVLVLFWILPVPAMINEWHRLITSRASAAAATLGFIQHALDSHHTPYDSLSPKALTPPGEGRRVYLELRRGFFAGYISCFAHGDDLYIGWTFWIYVSPLRALIMRLGRKVQDYTGRGNDIYQTLRYESTQATITAIYACTLEGIDFAMNGSDPPADATSAPAVPAPVPAMS